MFLLGFESGFLRTAMAAMTALTLHDLIGGRFVLGLGASGLQVVEGLHSVRYHPPIIRLIFFIPKVNI